MKKILICLALASCTPTKDLYRPYKLKKISQDLNKVKDFIEEDWRDDKIDEGVARNYYLLIKSLSYQIEQEYDKAHEIYKQNTKSKR